MTVLAGERLHGTDGIRGLVSKSQVPNNPIEKLILQREISPSLMQVIGLATGTVIISQKSKSGAANQNNPLVVIGWDRRDGNAELVDSLELGLLQSGCDTQRIGEVPTPGLHHCLLLCQASAGMMVTASHNPATDSGVKLFDENGFKSMPELEDTISEIAWAIVEERCDVASLNDAQKGTTRLIFDGLDAYRRHLKSTLTVMANALNIPSNSIGDSIGSQGLLLDSSGGAATDWLGFGLTRRGLMTEEVADTEQPINANCGAGEFSSTDSWTFQYLMENEQSHLLLKKIAERLRENDGMAPWDNGELIAAALDGDGDRCLLIEATKKGARIVDGDQMAFDWLMALKMAGKSNLKMAHSIESDLCLPAACDNQEIETSQTAIGDRWLSNSLRSTIPKTEQLFIDESMPNICGCEDSGHLVMPSPHPHKSGYWGLAGDGAATLIAQLLARTKLGEKRQAIDRGWKTRVSIKGVDRTLWDGANELSHAVEDICSQEFGEGVLSRVSIEGENSLLLLEGRMNNIDISVGVRNSGTEAKTSVTIRTSDNEYNLSGLADKIANILSSNLIV